MKDDDVGAVAQLHLDAYEVEWQVDKARAYIEKFYRFEPTACFVAEDGGRLVGATLGYSFERETGLVLFSQELTVHPDFRHKGVAKQLVSKLRESVGGRHTVKVKPIVKADTGVLNFYNSLGFEKDKAISFSFDE